VIFRPNGRQIKVKKRASDFDHPSQIFGVVAAIFKSFFCGQENTLKRHTVDILLHNKGTKPQNLRLKKKKINKRKKKVLTLSFVPSIS
jgi:hypothetical protein